MRNAKSLAQFISASILIFSQFNAYAAKSEGFTPLREVQLSPPTSDSHFDNTEYSKCIIENGQKSISYEVKMACKVLATPKICREKSGDHFLKCLEYCKNENFISRTFGDCKFN
jgi:hypothetical protein